MVRETVLDNGLKVLIREGAYGAAGVGVVLVSRRLERRGPGRDRCVALVRAHELQGHEEHSSRPGEGIIEKFGGTWNGYTWIDQTTYVETASKDALDRMLFIEAERMDACLYDPADCESERTVIISELQGGENDPSVARYRSHGGRVQSPSVSPPDHRLAVDLQSMTREDLYGHYRRFYVPSNATLVIVGDVDTDDVLKRWSSISAASRPDRPAKVRQVEPEQQAERRVVLRKEGATAYWKAAFHAPAFADDNFFPLLVADAVLNGAAGLNIWSMGGVSRPQRSARLYRALVDKGLASTVSGALMPTEHPYLYSINAGVAEGSRLPP